LTEGVDEKTGGGLHLFLLSISIKTKPETFNAMELNPKREYDTNVAFFKLFYCDGWPGFREWRYFVVERGLFRFATVERSFTLPGH